MAVLKMLLVTSGQGTVVAGEGKAWRELPAKAAVWVLTQKQPWQRAGFYMQGLAPQPNL